MKNFGRTVASLVVLAAVGTSQQGPRIALLQGEGDTTAQWSDVEFNMNATGVFNTVDVIHVSGMLGTTPSLAQLQGYDSVLVWSNEDFTNAVALGDVLADYVDAGGGVVVAAFANLVPPQFSNRLLGGRWQTGGYELLVQAGFGPQVQNMPLGVHPMPNHPLLGGVSTFLGGGWSYRPSAPGSVSPHAQVVGTWQDGAELIVASSQFARRVDLGMWPVSSAGFVGGWLAATDGDRILANALLYAAGALVGPATYCTTKMNSLGCSPTISGNGTPSASATSGFTIDCGMVRNNKSGLLFCKANGAQANVTFQCGTLCVGPSGIKRTPAQSAGGNAPPANYCFGVFSLDMNAFAAGLSGGNPDPALLVPGALVQAQWWGRDQGFPVPCNTTLSDAVEFQVGP